MDDEGFEICINFESGSGDPSRIFKAMSGLIDAIQALDSHLAASFDIALTTTLVLDEIESGSIKARLRNLISGIPDEAIKDGDWKKILGIYLLKAKYAILDWTNEKESIENRSDVQLLEAELLRLAEETDIRNLPAYMPPNAETLLSDVYMVQESLGNLSENDSATYQYRDNAIKFNKDLNISNEVVREVLTKEVIEISGKRILKVKKPDYLGQSMWAFQLENRAIEAKVTDRIWLQKFQNRGEDVRPGDSLRVLLYEEVSYGYEGEIIHHHYEVKTVEQIIRPPSQRNISF